MLFLWLKCYIFADIHTPYVVKNITSIICARRKSLKIGQEEMAKCLGITRPSYNALENGKRDISLNRLQDICTKLDLRVIVLPTENLF